MTVRRKSAADSIDKEILFKLLFQKPLTKRRREFIHLSGSSVPNHISRKLRLEEHKLDMQLQKIEKERKQFLNRSNNEKHLLRLSVHTAKASENRRCNGQCLVIHDNTRCHSSTSDYVCFKEGWLF